MKKIMLSSTRNVITGAVLLIGLIGNSAWAACTTTNLLVATVAGSNCVADVNTLKTNLATTNTNLATTNTNLATTNTNLATTNSNLVAGDAATLTSSKAYTDAKALSVGADTLNAANNYTNAKTAETLKSANVYSDTRSVETLKSANNYTNEQVTKLDSKTASGIAATAAMVNIPAPSSAGKTLSVGIAVGHYDGQTALAVGAQKRFSESGIARFGLASSTGKGAKPVVGAGAAWEF